MASKIWDEITYPFLNFNGAIIEVWEWVGNFIPHFIMDVIVYPILGLKLTMSVKQAPGVGKMTVYSYLT